MKKLVPALRSRSSMMTAAVSTLKASRLKMAVTNHAQQVRGMRIQYIPCTRCFNVVVTKLIALITEARQNRPMLTSHKSVPNPCPGPAEARALSGAYCVQPANDAPPGAKNADIRTRNETSVVQNPAIFSQ